MVRERRIFKPSKLNWTGNAIVGGPWSDDLRIAASFKYAAELVVADALDHSGLADYAFYPACFCYRHSAELVLKNLLKQMGSYVALLKEIGEATTLDEGKLTRSLDGTHDLMALAGRLKESLEGVSEEKFDSRTWSVLGELNSFDATSQAFRYAVSKASKPHFPDQQTFGLDNIEEAMTPALDYLFYMTAWLDAEIENARAYLEDWRQEMQ